LDLTFFKTNALTFFKKNVVSTFLSRDLFSYSDADWGGTRACSQPQQRVATLTFGSVSPNHGRPAGRNNTQPGEPNPLPLVRLPLGHWQVGPAAHASFFILFFLDRHNTKEPISISTKHNKLSIKQPIDFFFHSVINTKRRCDDPELVNPPNLATLSSHPPWPY
jgi:hypothetical protein